MRKVLWLGCKSLLSLDHISLMRTQSHGPSSLQCRSETYSFSISTDQIVWCSNCIMLLIRIRMKYCRVANKVRLEKMSRSFTDDKSDGGVWVRKKKKFLSKDPDRPKERTRQVQRPVFVMTTFSGSISSISSFAYCCTYLGKTESQQEFSSRQILEEDSVFRKWFPKAKVSTRESQTEKEEKPAWGCIFLTGYGYKQHVTWAWGLKTYVSHNCSKKVWSCTKDVQ